MDDQSVVDALIADCRAVVDQIAEHKRAVVALTVRRDGIAAELRRLGLPERAVGRLLGISGPRVNQITGGKRRPGSAPTAAELARQRSREAREDDHPPAVPPVVLRQPEPGGSR
jgi:DNA-binding transcriptional regulator YdaS (Cro superfamily)